jgi:phosphomevalonate kinase
MAQTTCISAPGKVLIAGGYLVLDRAHSGVVVSTSSRFYTTIRSGHGSPNTAVVRSPQFEGGEWTYTVDLGVSPVKIEQQG